MWGIILSLALAAGATETVPLELIMLDEGKWGPETIYPHVERAQQIFAACGIRFEPRLVSLPTPGFDRRAPNDQELVEAHPPTSHPAVYLFDGKGSEAYGEDFSPTSPRRVLEYTAWIGSEINTPEYVRARNPSYDTLAHEIAHLLCNCGHVAPGVPNLLSGQVEFVNDQVTPEQCEQFRHSPLVRSRSIAAF